MQCLGRAEDTFNDNSPPTTPASTRALYLYLLSHRTAAPNMITKGALAPLLHGVVALL